MHYKVYTIAYTVYIKEWVGYTRVAYPWNAYPWDACAIQI